MKKITFSLISLVSGILMWIIYNSPLNDFGWWFFFPTVFFGVFGILKERQNKKLLFVAVLGLLLSLPGFYVIGGWIYFLISGGSLMPF